MDPVLNPSESSLLEYLKTLTLGHGERISLSPRHVLRELRISRCQFEAAANALAALRFVGTRRPHAKVGGVESVESLSIWITGDGERFLKRRHFDHRRAAGSGAR